MSYIVVYFNDSNRGEIQLTDVDPPLVAVIVSSIKSFGFVVEVYRVEKIRVS